MATIPSEQQLLPWQDEVRKLEAKLAEQRLGACVYTVGNGACCAQMTELMCGMLNGAWFAGEACPRPNRSRVELALEELQRKLNTQQVPPQEGGVCVYAAGDRVCTARLTEGQCDLIGGAWFAEEKEKEDASA